MQPITIQVVYKSGVFALNQELDFPEGTELEMTILSVNAQDRAIRLANESAKLDMKEEQAMTDGNFD